MLFPARRARAAADGSSHRQHHLGIGPLVTGSVVAGLQLIASGAALAQTSYQASVVQPSCVSATSCKFVFPAPAGNLTITHVSCSIVSTLNQSTGAGGVTYFKLFSSAAPTTQDFIPPDELVIYGDTFLHSEPSEATVYSVPAGATPEITARSSSAIAAPNTVDEPTCFISGTVD